jgi:hypothetical protein
VVLDRVRPGRFGDSVSGVTSLIGPLPFARAVHDLLSESHLLAGYRLPELANRYVSAFGGTEALCYLSDLQQNVLVPFLGPDGVGSGQHVESLAVESTLAGRAYQQNQMLVQRHPSGTATVMLPMLDGAERVGVLAVTVASDDPEYIAARQEVLHVFASLLAELVAVKTMYGDTIVRQRRQSQMGLAAELQWSVLPPLTFACPEVTVAAVLEPAYEVAGDTFDYAVDAGVAQVAVFDGMGHGLSSAQLALMAVTAYRHARRAGRSLEQCALAIDDTLLTAFGGTSFTTGVLAELDTDTGALRWVNAGHPEPLLLRHGRLVKSLHVQPRPPLGMKLSGVDVSREPLIGSVQLEPEDCVLFYTDGVIEARSPDGDFFGEQRLVDLVVRNLAAELPAPETMRRVVRALLDHQQGTLTDDASLALLQWPTARAAMAPT